MSSLLPTSYPASKRDEDLYHAHHHGHGHSHSHDHHGHGHGHSHDHSHSHSYGHAHAHHHHAPPPPPTPLPRPLTKALATAKRHPRALLVLALVLLYLFGGSLFSWFLGTHLRTPPTATEEGALGAGAAANSIAGAHAPQPSPPKDPNETLRRQLQKLQQDLADERHRVAELMKQLDTPAAAAPPSPAAPTEKLALVAVLSAPASLHRRALIRATALQLLPPGLDVRFIVGATPSHPSTTALVALEQRAHADVVVLDSVDESGLNATASGVGASAVVGGSKAVRVLEAAAKGEVGVKGAKYRFLVKCDEDVFVHFVNLRARLEGLKGEGIYFGRKVSALNAMHESAYALSWSIVTDLATHQIPKTDPTHLRDALLPLWLTSADISHVRAYEPAEPDEVYADPAWWVPPNPDEDPVGAARVAAEAAAAAAEGAPKVRREEEAMSGGEAPGEEWKALAGQKLAPGTLAVLGLREDRRFAAVASHFLRHLDPAIRAVAASEGARFGAPAPVAAAPKA
ncbi:hypothetical protein HDU96_010832 [Phlyctochytrium bullatum]|nr:hypothetical protein HDU96_010832 [Phlyctochytrium bullatum]